MAEGVMCVSGGRGKSLSDTKVLRFIQMSCEDMPPPCLRMTMFPRLSAQKKEWGQQSGSLNYKTGQFLNANTTVAVFITVINFKHKQAD